MASRKKLLTYWWEKSAINHAVLMPGNIAHSDMELQSLCISFLLCLKMSLSQADQLTTASAPQSPGSFPWRDIQKATFPLMKKFNFVTLDLEFTTMGTPPSFVPAMISNMGQKLTAHTYNIDMILSDQLPSNPSSFLLSNLSDVLINTQQLLFINVEDLQIKADPDDIPPDMKPAEVHKSDVNTILYTASRDDKCKILEVQGQVRVPVLKDFDMKLTDLFIQENDILKLTKFFHYALGFVQVVIGPVKPVFSASLTTARLTGPQQCTVYTGSQLCSAQECLYPVCTIPNPTCSVQECLHLDNLRTMELFIEMLKDFSIEMTQCSYKADEVIPQLTMIGNCPVFSNDSDFLNVQFISLVSLELDNLEQEKSIMGIEITSERHRKIKGLLMCLSKERCANQAIDRLFEYLQENERFKLKQKVLDSVNIYNRVSPTLILTYLLILTYQVWNFDAQFCLKHLSRWTNLVLQTCTTPCYHLLCGSLRTFRGGVSRDDTYNLVDCLPTTYSHVAVLMGSIHDHVNGHVKGVNYQLICSQQNHKKLI